jgi:FAS-associated factor 2
MVDAADKLAYFQAITGLEDPDLCTEILAAHGWDLELAISSFTSTNHLSPPENSAVGTTTSVYDEGGGGGGTRLEQAENRVAAGPGLAWRVVTLPISVISGGIGLISGAIGLGIWAAGGVLSYSMGMIGLGRTREGSARLVSVSAAAAEAMEFVEVFEREYGGTGPRFVGEGFMDALQRSRSAFKLMFVYLHSPDHPDTPAFCERTLCSEAIAAFVNENFVSWGGSIRASEGFKMSNSLKASRFPFCAVVMAATNQRIALLQQVPIAY